MIVIGWIDGGTAAGEFAVSVARVAAYEVSQRRLLTILRIKSGPQMPEGRNILVEDFLKTDGEWLFMVDSDMVFDYDVVGRLLATARREKVNMIGGLCFGANTEYGQFPTMYRNLDGLPVVLLEIPDEEIVDVDATGAAFTLTHRSVFENNQRDSPHKWFHRREVAGNKDHPGGFLGEDISWCWWLREREVRIIVDTTIEAGHVKPTIMSLENYPRNNK